MTNNEIMQRLQRPALAALLDRAALALSDPLGLDNELPNELTEVAKHLRAQTEQGETVYVATYEHKHGRNIDVFSTEQAALDVRDDIATQWWDKEIVDEAKPAQRIGERYFEIMGGRGQEFYTIHQCEVLA